MKGKSPAAIAAALGLRLKRARLNADMTQVELADLAGLSRKVVLSAEKGNVKLESLVAIMWALKLDDQIDGFLPEPALSPMELAKLQGKKRQRASGKTVTKGEATSAW